jgi:hypothetical protein
MLTERLDHHRGRGQQQIVVKHVTTVNADQAVITESIMSGKTASKDTPQLAAGADRTMQIIESSRKEAVPVGEVQKRNDRQPHAPMQRCSAMSRQIEADRPTVHGSSGTWLLRLPDARRSRWSPPRQTKWQLPARLPHKGNDRA